MSEFITSASSPRKLLFLPSCLWSSDIRIRLPGSRNEPDLVRQVNSDYGKSMHLAPTEFVSHFDTRAFVRDGGRYGADVPVMALEPNREPHILLATTGQLPSTARLAMELHAADARVSLISPSNHPAKALDLFAHTTTYRALSPRHSLEGVLLRLRPDVVIPCDERAVRDLHTIWRQTRHQDVRSLIEQSAGPAANFPTVTSRAALLALARQEGIRVPASMALPDSDALEQWMAANPAPFVLKADGSWAGFGVRIVSDASKAMGAYRQMTRRASGRLAFREALLEGNNFALRPWLRRERPAMSVQTYIDGWPANIGVACWQGEVLAAVCAESVSTVSATGPSTVARIIDNQEMIDTAKRVAMALRLSGMVGFDFMIEAATGAAYLIEMNPRNTPICAIRLGPGRDLAEALVARLASRPVRERPPHTERDIVVFFPDTWQEDPSSHFLRSGYHDVPWERPELVRVLMQPERRERYRILRWLRRAWLGLTKDRKSPP